MTRAPSLQPGTVQVERARRNHASKAQAELRLRKGVPEKDVVQSAETSVSAGRDDMQSATRSPLTGVAEPVTVRCTVTPLDWPYPNGPIPYSSSSSPSSSCAPSDVTLARPPVDRTKCPPRSSASKPPTSSSTANPLPLVRASSASDSPAIVEAGDTRPAAPPKANAIAIASIKENTASLTRNIQQLKAISQSVKDREDFTTADARRNIAMQDLFKAHGADPDTARAMVDAALDVFKSSPVRPDSLTRSRSSPLAQEHTHAKSRRPIPAQEPKVSVSRRELSSANDPNHVASASASFDRRVPKPQLTDTPSKPDSRGTSGVSVKATAMSSPTRVKYSAPAADTRRKGPSQSPQESRRSPTTSTGVSSVAKYAAHDPVVHAERGVQAQTSSHGSYSTTPPRLARRPGDAPLGTPSPKKRFQELPAEGDVAPSSSVSATSSNVKTTRSTPLLSRAVMPAPKSTLSLKTTSRPSTADSNASRAGVVDADRDPQTRTQSKDIPRSSRPEDHAVAAETSRVPGHARTQSSARSRSSLGEKDVTRATSSASAKMTSSTSSKAKKAVPPLQSEAEKGPAPAVPKTIKSASLAVKNPPGGSSTRHNSPAPKPSSGKEKTKVLDIAKLSQSTPIERPRSQQPAAGKSSHSEKPDDRSMLRTESVSSVKHIPAVPAAPSERSSVVSYATMIVDRSPPTAPAHTAPQTAQEVVSPFRANFFAGSVTGSSASVAEFDDDFDYDSPFGRPKPLLDFLSMAPATMETLGVLQNASLSQVDVMKPNLVERTTIAPMRGKVVPPPRRAGNGNAVAVGVKSSSAAVAASGNDNRRAGPSTVHWQVPTTLQNTSNLTLVGPSRGPPRGSRARAGSLTSPPAKKLPFLKRDLRRASRNVDALIDAIMPSYESLRRANSFMNAVYFSDGKVPDYVHYMRDIMAEEYPHDYLEEVQEAAIKRKNKNIEPPQRDKVRPNVLTRALQGLGGIIKKPSGVFLSTPPDVGTSRQARKK